MLGLLDIRKNRDTSIHMLKNLINNFFTYSLGAIILRSITSLIAFSSINFLNPQEYGLLALINTFIGIVPIFFNLGLRQAFWLDFFHTDNQRRKQIINDIIAIYLLIASPIFILSLISVDYINKIIFINKATNSLIYLSLIICFLHFFIELFFQVFRYQEKAKTLVIIQIIMGIINLFCAVTLIYFLNYKIWGIIFANLLSIVLICIYAFYLYIKKIKSLKFNISKDKQKIFYYLKLGLPFIPSIIFSWFLSFADRWILAHYKTFYEVGIYSLSDSFAQLFQAIILLPIISSYQPYILKKFSENKNNLLKVDAQNLTTMFYTMVFILIFVILGFVIFKNILYYILPIKFHKSVNYILILLIGQIFFLGSQFATSFLVFLKKSYILMWIMIFCASLNIGLNYLLIIKYSLLGCSLATLISYFIYLFLVLSANFCIKKNFR